MDSTNMKKVRDSILYSHNAQLTKHINEMP